jgi:hypothetical protein
LEDLGHAHVFRHVYDRGLYLWLDSVSSFLMYIQKVGLLGPEISPSRGRYLHPGQNKPRINAHTNIHASNGIQTHDPSVRAGEDSSCFRPRGHCDQHDRDRNHKRENICFRKNIINYVGPNLVVLYVPCTLPYAPGIQRNSRLRKRSRNYYVDLPVLIRSSGNNGKKRNSYELIANFPLIRHGPHRKLHLQQFFVTAGTCLPSCCLATIGGYTYRHTD